MTITSHNLGSVTDVRGIPKRWSACIKLGKIKFVIRRNDVCDQNKYERIIGHGIVLAFTAQKGGTLHLWRRHLVATT
jgi:hypothetical protein